MSNPNTIINAYVGLCQQLTSTLDQLALYGDMIDQDSTIITRYFDNTSNPGHRTDIVAADITAAKAAVGQVAFAYNSGNPPQKAPIYKLAP